MIGLNMLKWLFYEQFCNVFHNNVDRYSSADLNNPVAYKNFDIKTVKTSSIKLRTNIIWFNDKVLWCNVVPSGRCAKGITFI